MKELENKIKNLLDDIDTFLEYQEDISHGADSQAIIKLRCKISTFLDLELPSLLTHPQPSGESWEKLKELIYESLGSASMCWSEMPRGEFNEKQAIEIGNKLINAMHEYANQKQEKPLTEWISVKDRLPKEYCHCLIYCPSSFPKNIRVLSATFYDDNNMFYCDASEMPHEDVTHWMLLPETPKQ